MNTVPESGNPQGSGGMRKLLSDAHINVVAHRAGGVRPYLTVTSSVPA
jgi:hypothetical protein